MPSAFNNDSYIKKQSEKILERIDFFKGKLYLEFGGKLFDDNHASRILPGFKPDTKLKMLLTLKEKTEIIVVINSQDIISNKVRTDLAISYNDDVLRLIDAFKEVDLMVSGVIITQYEDHKEVQKFIKRLTSLGVTVALNYKINNYPNNANFIVSEEGLGMNQFIKTTKELVVVTAPGPGSGKMSACLSQIYHENLNGNKCGYAKFETFPVHNLALKHLVNVAYEAATIDLFDVNMIDPFHLEAYNQLAVNYNRDIEVFPVLNKLLNKILEDCPYNSPTDMGVNMVGYCIEDEEAVKAACVNEIIRRYYQIMLQQRLGTATNEMLERIENLLANNDICVNSRECIQIANDLAEEVNVPVVSLTLKNGITVTGKSKSLLGASSACVLNALKEIAGLGSLSNDLYLISPNVIEPIQKLKIGVLGNNNPRLHLDETLIALSVSALTNPTTAHALNSIDQLRGTEAHSTVILSEVDKNMFRRLGVNLTENPVYQTKRLYHKK